MSPAVPPLPSSGPSSAPVARPVARRRIGSFPAALATVTAAWLIAAPILSPSWGPNDDPVMAMMVDGRGISQEGDPHLFFSHILVGQALTLLYRAWPAVPWYGLYLLGALFTAHVALADAALRTASWRRVAGAFGVYFFSAGLVQLGYLSFTGVAVMVSAAGLLLGAQVLATGGGRWALVAAGGLALFGSLVRFEALPLAFLLVGPAGAILLLRTRAQRIGLAFVAAVVAGAGTMRVVDAAAYWNDSLWAEFRRFNAARVSFTDYPMPSDESAEAVAALGHVGWTSADYRFLTRWWFHGDLAVYSRANLEHLLDRLGIQGPFARWSDAEAALASIVTDRRFVAVTLLGFVLLLACRRDRRSLLAVRVTFGVAVVVLLLLVWCLRAPPAVFLAVAAAPAAAALALGGPRLGVPSSGSRRLFAAALGAVAIVAGAVAHHRAAEWRRHSRVQLSRLLASLQASGCRVLVAWSGAFAYEAFSPLETMAELGELQILSVGWPQRTPLARRLLAEWRAEDPLDLLLGNPTVALIAPGEVLPEITDYLRRRRGVAVRFDRVLSVGSARVFRAQVQAPSAPPSPAGARPVPLAPAPEVRPREAALIR